MTHKRLFAGATFIVAAELMFALMAASIRHASAELNNGMVVFGAIVGWLFRDELP